MILRPWHLFVGAALASSSCAPHASHAPAPVAANAPNLLPHTTFTIPSRALGETRRVNVYRPVVAGGDAAWPVLYMPDGGVEEDFPHVIAAVDAAVRAGEMRPVIVVGIENTERRRDMTGPTTVARDKTIAPRVGGSSAFRAFLRDELIPTIETREHPNGEKAIIGESLAGLFVVETLLTEPTMFDTYIALSPSLWWNGGALVQETPAWLASHPSVRARLLVASASDDDTDDRVAAFTDALRAGAPKTLAWEYEVRSDLRHSTIYRGLEGVVLRKAFARNR